MANVSLLDEQYDFALLGTSLPLSILSAALSRAGFSVLHIDDAEYYGGPWASLTLKELIELKTKRETKKDDLLFDGLIDIDYKFSSIFSSSTKENIDKQQQIPAELQAVNRHFAISLAPSLLPCSGSTIDVLVRSKVANYCTFRLLQQTGVYSKIDKEDDWSIRNVPSSKEDIFKDKSLSLVDKRRLMKLLQKAAPKPASSSSSSSSSTTEENIDSTNFDQIQESFLDYLTKSADGPKFSLQLANDVIFGVALCSTSKESTSKAMKRIQKHIMSIGRYGNSAYLIGQYGGAGEMAQCFSRASAVQGGTFVLGHKIKELDRIEGNSSLTTTSQKNEFGSQWKISLEGIEGSCQAGCVVGDQDILRRIGKISSPSSSTENIPKQAIGILLLDRGMRLKSEEGDPSETALVTFPPTDEKSGSIWALQMGEGTFSCPKGTYLVYLCTSLPEISSKSLNTTEQARKALSFAREGVLNLASKSKPEWKSSINQSDVFEPLFECYMVRESISSQTIQQQSLANKESLLKNGFLSVPSSLENLVTSLDDATQQAEDIYWLVCGKDGIGREKAEELRKKLRRNAANSSNTVGRGLAGIPNQEETEEESIEKDPSQLVLDFFPISEEDVEEN